MGIVLLVFFIVPEADFQQSWYKYRIPDRLHFTVFWKSGYTVRNLSPWILVQKYFVVRFLDLCV